MNLGLNEDPRERYYNVNDRDMWPILQRLDKWRHREKLERCHIFGPHQSMAFLFTKTKQTFSFGVNRHQMLGFFGKNPVLTYEPLEIAAFNQQVISKIVEGDRFILALTNSGRLYSWGCRMTELNCKCEEGPKCGIIPARIDLIKNDVKDVACGFGHVLILTKKNQLYLLSTNEHLWKSIRYSYNEQFCQGQPTLTASGQFGIPGTPTHIACLDYASVAVTDRNEIYLWGQICGGEWKFAYEILRMSDAGAHIIQFVSGGRDGDPSSAGYFALLLSNKEVIILEYDVKQNDMHWRSIPQKNITQIMCPSRGTHLICVIEQPTTKTYRTSKLAVYDFLQESFLVTNELSIPDVTCLYTSAYTPFIAHIPSNFFTSVDISDQDEPSKKVESKFPHVQLWGWTVNPIDISRLIDLNKPSAFAAEKRAKISQNDDFCSRKNLQTNLNDQHLNSNGNCSKLLSNNEKNSPLPLVPLSCQTSICDFDRLIDLSVPLVRRRIDDRQGMTIPFKDYKLSKKLMFPRRLMKTINMNTAQNRWQIQSITMPYILAAMYFYWKSWHHNIFYCDPSILETFRRLIMLFGASHHERWEQMQNSFPLLPPPFQERSIPIETNQSLLALRTRNKLKQAAKNKKLQVQKS